MTVVNPKSISGINSITTGSGSDNLLTIHTSDANNTERLRIDSTGATKIVTGIVTTLTATTGIVTTLTANTVTSLGAVSGTTGTFSGQMQSASAVVTGGITATGGNIVMNDSSGSSANRIKLGTSQDLELYHDGSNSFIKDGTGSSGLVIQAPLLAVKNAAGSENMIVATEDEGVELMHNGTKRFETTGIGVSIPSGAGNCLRVFGQNVAHAGGSALVIGQDSGTVSELRAYGSNTSTNGTIRFRSSRSDGSSSVDAYYDGNLQFASGYGIDFSETANSGTTGASMSSELLDDYEEGTWTPTVTGNTFTQYLNQWYTKVGQVVTCYLYMYNWSDNSSNTHLKINGLPFAHKTNHEASFEFQSNGNASLGSNCMGIWGRIGVTGTTTQIAVFTHFNTTGGGYFYWSNLGTTHLMATFTYVAA